jgi:glycosyltransferase involved in cell wall biosynthesis
LNKKVLFLLPYPLHRAPSQRFRVEAYFYLLREHNISFTTREFLDDKAWQILYTKGSLIKKGIAVSKGYLRRIKLLFKTNGYTHVFIHREAAPLGPPVFEWFLAKLLQKKIIYDFDDAIWIPNTSSENKFASWLKAFWKVKYICRWSYKITAGNEYLYNYARKYNPEVVLLPTCVDMVNRYNKIKEHKAGQTIIGWTGSHSTMHYLDEILPVLKKIISEYDVQLMIVSNRKPVFDLPNLKFIHWRESSEIDDLLKFDIGLMPLKADAWSEGKCGFKLIQYSALGIPCVSSPVGVNKEIVEENVTGFLCETEAGWYGAIKRLLLDPGLRKYMGTNGHQKMQRQFSIQANSGAFLDVFN